MHRPQQRAEGGSRHDSGRREVVGSVLTPRFIGTPQPRRQAQLAA
jgi:hypothetical protein